MKRSLVWIVFHSLVIVLTLVGLFTGFRIAILDKPLLFWLSPLLPQGDIHQLHIASGFGVFAIVLVYAVLSIRRLNLNHVIQGASANRQRVSLYHRVLHWCGYVVFPLIILTGFLIFFDISEFVVQWDLHFILACAAFAYLLLHGGGYFVHFGLPIFKRIFYPDSFRSKLQLLMLVVVAVVGGLSWWLWGAKPTVLLNVATVDIKQFMDIDGKADESVWGQAEKLTIQTHGGANFKDGSTKVSIQAVENGVEAYFLFTWEDDTKSLQHLPLVKTADGWQVQHNGFYEFNEVEFYEDKFAVMLSDRCESGGAGTTHMGPKPLSDKPANWHGKGYHYAEDGVVRDIWHWKAVRTNDMYLADDNFFGAPRPAKAGERRYKAGYVTDGKESGSYVMNWQWFQTQQITPRRMPKTPNMIDAYQTDTANQSWVISWFDYEPYQAAKDQYPQGTIMPSVLYSSNQFEGDRADVRARAVWANGKWSLEIARKLNTSSVNDVPLQNGICLWVSAFDRSQVAHTRHHQAIELIFGAAND